MDERLRNLILYKVYATNKEMSDPKFIIPLVLILIFIISILFLAGKSK